MENRMKEIRLQRQISLKKCHRDTGISIRTLKRYEHGEITAGMEYLVLLANYYDVTIDELLKPKFHEIDEK